MRNLTAFVLIKILFDYCNRKNKNNRGEIYIFDMVMSTYTLKTGDKHKAKASIRKQRLSTLLRSKTIFSTRYKLQTMNIYVILQSLDP